MDLWVQRRSVLDGALDAVLEKLKIHEATGRHLSHYVAWLKVATRTRRTAQIARADDINPIGKSLCGFFH